MQSQSMLHIYSALLGGTIEYTALPTGGYLDIDSPCSLIAVVMKNSKPNPSPLPHLLS